MKIYFKIPCPKSEKVLSGFIINHCLFLSEPFERWFFIPTVPMNATFLPLAQDENPVTCESVKLDGTAKIIKTAVVPCKTLKVTIVVAGDHITFGPTTDRSGCSKTPSLMLFHDAVFTGEACSPFCQVPGTCLIENTELSSYSTMYNFTCLCLQRFCDELLIRLQPETRQITVAICEITLIYPNL